MSARRPPLVDIVAVASLVAAVTSVSWGLLRYSSNDVGEEGRNPPLPGATLSLDGRFAAGEPGASVAVVIFSGFECPYCGRFARATWPALRREYVETGKVQFVFWSVPLLTIHAFAFQAAQAAVCAGGQGQFWQMHDSLFMDQTRLHHDDLVSRGMNLKLDMPRFESCLSDPGSAARVSRDLQEAATLGVTSTPTFLVGLLVEPGELQATEFLVGSKSLSQFRRTLDAAVASRLRHH